MIVTTTGDARTDVPIHAIGGTGVFVKEVQEAVLDGRADVAVHSAKDLPAVARPDGLVLAAVPERADPRDVLVGSTLDALPAGARVGTGSVRRRAQLAALRPDLTFAELRGNIPTRLDKAGDFDAIVVAAAALERLGLRRARRRVLEPSVMLPAGRAGRARGRVPRRRRRDAASASPRIDDTRAHARGRRRARVPRASSAAAATCPCGALATLDGGRGGGRGAARGRPTAASCCGRPRATPSPIAAGDPRRRPSCSTAAVASLLDDEDGIARDRLPRRRRARRSRAPHRARRRAAARAPTSWCYDRLASPALLDLAPADAELITVGKAPGPGRPHPGADQRGAGRPGPDRGLRRAAQGRRPVRVRPGRRGGRGAGRRRRPLRGGARHHQRHRRRRLRGHPGDPPRASSTHFTVVTGHEDPAKDRTDVDWEALARAGGTLVILMGAGRIGDIARRLIDGGRAADTPVAAVRNGTRPDQHTVRATLATHRRRRRASRRARSSSATSPRSTSRGSRPARCSVGRSW